MKTCGGISLKSDLRYLEAATNQDLVEGIRRHADPEWWKTRHITACNQAYLRRWGTYLRREARRRGLL